MQIIHKLTLDCGKTGTQAVIPIAQGDMNCHLLMIDFCLNGTPLKLSTGLYATLYAQKPDGTEILDSCVCYGETGAYPNTVVHILGNDASSAHGQVNCRIIIGNGVSTLHSPEFALRVEENSFLGLDLTSSSEYSRLISLVGEASDSALVSRAWAVGENAEGELPQSAPQYQNNAKYYAQLAKSYLVTDSSVTEGSARAVQSGAVKVYVDSALTQAVGALLSSSL